MDEHEEERKEFEVVGFDMDDLFSEEELHGMMARGEKHGLFHEGRNDVVGFCIQQEFTCPNSECGKRHLHHDFTGNPVTLVIAYQAAIQAMKDEGIKDRAIRLLMVSFPLPEHLSPEEKVAFEMFGKSPKPTTTQLCAWIGSEELDMDEVAKFLEEQNGE